MNLKQNNIYIKTKDFLVSGEPFDLLYDEEKKMLYTSPQPNVEDLSTYYESEAYISHTDSKKGIMPFLYQKVKKYSLQKKVNLISSLNKDTGNLLDIGAGTGDFLKLAQEKGWNVFGVEPNQKAASFAREKKIHLETSLENFSGKQFDVITLWHVLEHLPDLDNTVKEIEHLLKPGGVLVIAVPNFKSFDAKHYKKYWAAYDAPRHLWHFSRDSMELLFSENIKLKKIKPMIFDSFYVSLLSEKYKSGNKFSLKSIFIGFWSNLRAWSTKEYSSLIYCYKKSL